LLTAALSQRGGVCRCRARPSADLGRLRENHPFAGLAWRHVHL